MGCWCVKPDKLARAVFRVQDCEWKLQAQKDEASQREKAILGSYELRLKTVKDYCDEQVGLLRDGCADKMGIVISQNNEVVNTVVAAYAEKVKAYAGEAAKPPRWYESNVLWMSVGAVLGVAGGLGVGALLWK